MKLSQQDLKKMNLEFDDKNQILKKNILSNSQNLTFNSKEENIRIEQELSRIRQEKNKNKKVVKKRHFEEDEQILLIKEINLRFPKIADILIHIPNGGSRKGGVLEGARFKRLGVKAGVSDLFLPLAKQGKHGLWIEFKAAKPNHSPVSILQKQWIEKMLKNDYAAYVCYGIDEAIKVIQDYLKD